MELQDCVIAKSLITEVECNLLPTRYRAINLQYLLARERNVIQNSICWVGGGDEHHFQRGKTSSAALTPLTAVSWKRDSIYVLVATPKDPTAPSEPLAESSREGCLLPGQEWQLVPRWLRRGGGTVASTSGQPCILAI